MLDLSSLRGNPGVQPVDAERAAGPAQWFIFERL